MIPALWYAVAGCGLGIILSLIALVLRRRHVASAALASGTAFLLIGYWGSVYESRFFDSVGHALGHLAMIATAAALFILVWRVVKSMVGLSPIRRRSVSRRVVSITLLCLAVLGAVGWGVLFGSMGAGPGVPPGESSRDGARNVLLITIDTLRADRLGCYGYPPDRGPRLDGLGTSPVIDGLALAGARFNAAVVPMVTTDPSHASIMTSLYPFEHGVVRNAVQLGSDATTLAEVFLAAGYRTGAAVSVRHLDGYMSGLSQGFTDYFDTDDNDRFGYHAGWRRAAKAFPGRVMKRQREAGETSERAANWILADDGRPFFLWVHFYDPHHPYVLHEEPGVAFRKIRDEEMAELPDARLGELAELASRAYNSEIRHVDTSVGRLLDALDEAGEMEETIVVVTSDHGEHISEERLRPTLWFGHYDVYEEVCRVPLVIWRPGLVDARVVPDQVSTMDIAPTLIELSGISEVPGPVIDGARFDGVFGRSLTALLDGGAKDEVPLIIDANPHGTAEGRAVRVGRWKLIRRPTGDEELYDLVSDPLELRNSAATDTVLVRLLRLEIDRIVASWADIETPELDEETREMLRALGYIN